MSRRLRVIVLTCAPFGHETAQALDGSSELDLLGVITAPYPQARLRVRIRRAHRAHGVRGLLRLALRKLKPPAPSTNAKYDYPVWTVDDFHSEQCLTLLRELRVDLAIIDGTYILKPSVFTLPRLGAINLHCGKVPEYRGAPPAFWELYDGVSEVGVTIHEVTAGIDQGPVLLEESFPIEPAPDNDPVEYARYFWLDVLRPNAIRMAVDAACGIARGECVPRPQPHSDAIIHKQPTRDQIEELRARVRKRRRSLARV